MYHSITFYNGTEKFNTYDDWFLVPEKRPLFAAPVPKTKYVDIPGADGQIDLTESLTGHPVFNNREGSWTFYVLNDHGEWTDRYSEIMAKIQGRLLKAVLEDEPEYYYLGRFYLSEWSNEPSYSKVTINYKAEPYKRSFQEDRIQIGEWGPTVLDSGDIVSFDYPNDHGAFKSLSAAITPTQSFNGYTKPWPGGAGKNLIDDSKRVKGGNALYIGVIATTLGIYLKAGEYTASAFFDYACRFFYRPVGGTGVLLFNNDTTHSGTFTISEDGDYQFYFYKNPQSEGELDPEQIGHVQIEAGTTSTVWEPYENICPITGQTSVSVRTAGKNLLAPAATGTTVRYGVTVENRTDGSVSFSGTAAQAVSFEFSQAVMPPGTYKYTAKGSTTEAEGNAALYLRNLDTASTIISMGLSAAQTETRTFTLSKPTLVRHYIVIQNGVTVSGDLYPMILLDGASNDDYEPNRGQAVTVSLGQEVYGGTIDVVSGTLTLTHRMLTIDGNTSSLSVGKSTATGSYYCASSPISEANAGINTISGGGLLCDRFNVYAKVTIGNTYLTGNGKTFIFVLPDQTIDDVAKARVWLTSNPVTWVYELATPQIVQLTGQQINTLIGQNNVWASTGGIEAEWGDNPGVIYNPTQFSVRPIIKVTNPTAGATVSLNGVTMTCSEAYQGEVIIDCDQMKIYSASQILNSKWTGAFPELKGGNNNASFSGCDSMNVVVNWRAL